MYTMYFVACSRKTDTQIKWWATHRWVPLWLYLEMSDVTGDWHIYDKNSAIMIITLQFFYKCLVEHFFDMTRQYYEMTS